jgi:flagellar hook-length control protein FliK
VPAPGAGALQEAQPPPTAAGPIAFAAQGPLSAASATRAAAGPGRASGPGPASAPPSASPAAAANSGPVTAPQGHPGTTSDDQTGTTDGHRGPGARSSGTGTAPTSPAPSTSNGPATTYGGSPATAASAGTGGSGGSGPAQSSSRLLADARPGALTGHSQGAAGPATAVAAVASPSAPPAVNRAVAGGGASTEPALTGDPRPEPVATQLATVLAPAARQPDGSYQVVIRLQPEELGVVHVELRLEGSTVNVSLHADGDATRDMLRQNLGQLRQQLASGGLTTGHFDVGSGPASDRENGAEGRQPAATSLDRPGYEGLTSSGTSGTGATPLLSSQANGLLDMRL